MKTKKNHFQTLLILALALCLSACAGTKNFNMSEMEMRLTDEAETVMEVTDSRTLKEIEVERRALKLPIRLAVAQPSAGKWGDNQIWTTEEMEIINSWEAPLKEAGIIRDLVILPASWQQGSNPSHEGRLQNSRKAAARFGSEALLSFNAVSEEIEYPNVFSLLNLTIVGMWIVPGHHRDAKTIFEGFLFDNRNEYIYAFSRGQGTQRRVVPFQYAHGTESLRDSRIKALKDFGENFIVLMRSENEVTRSTSTHAPQGARYETLTTP